MIPQTRSKETATRRMTLAAVVATTILLGAGCGDDGDSGVGPPAGDPPPENKAPTATIDANRTSVPSGDGFSTVVRLDASGSSDPDGDPLSFSWTVPSGRFVMGTGSTDATINVTFPGARPYTVTVVADDGRGGTDGASIVIGIQ